MRQECNMRHLLLIGPMAADPCAAAKRRIIADECEEHQWQPIWPDGHTAQAKFSIERWKATISDANLVLADLSLERPSCYFELGCIEITQRNLIVIAETGTPIHQTSYRDKVIFFDGLEVYKKIIRTILGSSFSLSEALLGPLIVSCS
jgi:hypothetical protein